MAAATRCTRCGHGSAVELEMKPKSGPALALMSCNHCDARIWTADGTPVSREDVLKLTAGDPEFVVMPSPAKAKRAKAAG